MAQASRQQTRQIGNLALLVAAPRPPAAPLADCLGDLQRSWQRGGHLAALWQAWPKACGPQLAPHCRPLRLQGGLLTVGAAPGPWLQALQYSVLRNAEDMARQAKGQIDEGKDDEEKRPAQPGCFCRRIPLPLPFGPECPRKEEPERPGDDDRSR